jgi:hypothetical protein
MASAGGTPSRIATQASAVPVRPWPPLHATSTRSASARRHSSTNALRASLGSVGNHQSGHRTHRDGQLTDGGRLPSRYNPNSGAGPSTAPRCKPRPRTTRPDGSSSTPAVNRSHGSTHTKLATSGFAQRAASGDRLNSLHVPLDDPLAGVAACVRGSARRDGAGGSVLACHGTKPSVTLADLCCLDQFRRARR